MANKTINPEVFLSKNKSKQQKKTKNKFKLQRKTKLNKEQKKYIKQSRQSLKQSSRKQYKIDKYRKVGKSKRAAKQSFKQSKKRYKLQKKQYRFTKNQPTSFRQQSYIRLKDTKIRYKLDKKRLKKIKGRDQLTIKGQAKMQVKNQVIHALSQDDTLQEGVNAYFNVKRVHSSAYQGIRIGKNSAKLVKNMSSHIKNVGQRTYNFSRGRGFQTTPKSMQKTPRQALQKKYRNFQNRLKHSVDKQSRQSFSSIVRNLFSGKDSMAKSGSALLSHPITWIILGVLLVFFLVLTFSGQVRPAIVQSEKELTASWDYMTELDAAHTDDEATFYTNPNDVMFYMNVKFGDYHLEDKRTPTQTYKQFLGQLWIKLNGESPDYELHSMKEVMSQKGYQLDKDDKDLYDTLVPELGFSTLNDTLAFPFVNTDELTASRRFGNEKKDGKIVHYDWMDVYATKGDKVLAPIAGKVAKVTKNQVTIEKSDSYRLTLKNVTSNLTVGTTIQKGQSIGQMNSQYLVIKYEKMENKEWYLVNPGFYFPKVSYVQQTILSSDLATPGADIASRAKYIFNYFSKLGFTKEGIAAILGNWQIESGINPKSAEGSYLNPPVGATATSWDDDNWLNMSGMDIYGNNTMIIHRGLGLGQFTDTRDGSNRNTLIRMYAKEKNKKWYDMDLQLDFIANADAPAYRTYLNRVGKSEVAKDVAGLTNYFLIYWEGNPNNKLADRIQAANYWFNYFSNPVNQSSYRLPLTVINLSSPFGWRNFGGVSEFHRGLDFAASMGTPIYAISDGIVLKAEYHYSWGNYVHIKHPDGRSSLYAHQSQLLVHAGQEVHQGDKIGLVGSTGNSTGAHLHLEISKSTSLAQGDLIDPATVLGLKK
ncbi:phage tail tip lysozyme [Enterococcus cecorum]|uniref:phage tail tip lysozyme n=6 Tax=Enterococcus cecorum TaxID=44008 RepID=UPI000ADA367C|nr:phage tail tip lysozyme [Enterococcus cecorum]MCJ0557365.1 phage tail tip lysozyme [Enterococcus cecorum]MCJ0562312.1 phage tail tip lysozyme [Enterococcus cecorum]MDZ5559668.1 phage tail tip lysozyme [Enterococcus cecorum]MDZ5583759.1 phage tail tip lysozyme [Enterococcus cecorum]CAI3410458.1 peptidoglycan DD-metalloendopeptidase family protein [Enterococcus cecorum]